jgi:hypothetical protein
MQVLTDLQVGKSTFFQALTNSDLGNVSEILTLNQCLIKEKTNLPMLTSATATAICSR